jgi:hypothetical protein
MVADKDYLLNHFRNRPFVISGLTVLELQHKLTSKSNLLKVFYINSIIDSADIIQELWCEDEYLVVTKLVDMNQLLIKVYSIYSKDIYNISISKLPEYIEYVQQDDLYLEREDSLFNTLYLEWRTEESIPALLGCLQIANSNQSVSANTLSNLKASINLDEIQSNRYKYPQINYEELLKNISILNC